MRATGEKMSHLHLARSSDGGETWTEPVSEFRGYPAACASLGSGKLLVVYGYRFDEGYGVRAWVFSSEGRDPSEEHVIRDDGAIPDLGYPHAVSLPDGRVFVVYYINSRADAADRAAPRFIESCIVSE